MSRNALSDLLVVEFAEDVAGPYCGRLLGAHGASVVKVEPSGGDKARRLPPFHHCESGEEVSGIFHWLNADKEIRLDRTADDIDTLIAQADVIIDDRAREARHQQLRQVKPDLIHCDVSWFGRNGPRASHVATDGIISVLTGQARTIGEIEGPPVLATGHGPQILAGTTAAIAVLAALLGRPGAEIEVSVFEAAMVLYEIPAVVRAHGGVVPVVRRGINRFHPTFPMGVYPCLDGWVGITALTPAQWRGFCELLELSDLLAVEDYGTTLGRLNHADDIDAAIKPKLMQWRARDLVEAGQARRVPLALAPTAAELLTQPELLARDAFDTITIDGGRTYLAPGIPFHMTLNESVGNVPTKRRPTDGLPMADWRIVDLSMGWSGPMATRYLADLGADVIKVEACQYPDWWRGYEQSEAWLNNRNYEKAPTFNVMNRNKRGITLDLKQPEGVALLKSLVAEADAVIENQSAGVLPRLGLGYDDLRVVNSDIVLLSMPAYGTNSPWAGHRAYGSTVEQAAGLPHYNGEAGWPPTQQHVALGDAVAGINAAVALLLALRHKAKTGQGQFVDLSQVECLLPLGAHGLIAQSLTGDAWPRLGNRHPVWCPHGVFPCRGGSSWIAVAVETDVQWDSLAETLGCSDWRGMDAADRRSREDEIEKALADWARKHEPDAAILALQSVGIPSGAVQLSLDLLQDPQLAAREFFTWASPVHGDVELPYPSQAFTLNGERLPIRRPAPKLGEHNREILQQYLALDEEVLEQLTRDRIIGERPLLS